MLRLAVRSEHPERARSTSAWSPWRVRANPRGSSPSPVARLRSRRHSSAESSSSTSSPCDAWFCRRRRRGNARSKRPRQSSTVDGGRWTVECSGRSRLRACVENRVEAPAVLRRNRRPRDRWWSTHSPQSVRRIRAWPSTPGRASLFAGVFRPKSTGALKPEEEGLEREQRVRR